MQSLNRFGSAIPYRPEIEGLRAIAVVSVVLFHLGFGLSGGFVGVDVFFVISGYLITQIIQHEVARDGTFDFTRFYLHRIRRLLPALLAMLAAAWIFAFLLLNIGHFRLFNLSLITAVLGFSNLHFLGEDGYFDGVPLNRPLLHTWSLGVEMQFYLVWPLLIYLLQKYATKAKILAVITLIGCVSLLADSVILHTDILPTYGFDIKAVGFYFTPFRVYEFAIGAALVWVIHHQPRSRLLSEILFFSGMGLIAAAAYFFTEKMPFPSYNALLPCIGAALIIYSIRANCGKYILALSPIRYVGKISYSLYLCHWPIIVFYTYYKNYYMQDQVTTAERNALLVWMFLAAMLMYHFIERPLRLGSAHAGNAESVRDIRPSPVSSYSALAACGALLIALAGFALRHDGWPDRTHFSPEFTTHYKNLGQFSNAWWAGKKCDKGCELNPSASRHVWVIGDSHAMHLKDGLIKQFPERHFTFVHNRCRFYSLTMCDAEQNPQRDAVMVQKSKTLEAIKRTSDDVIIAHYWDRINEGGAQGAGEGRVLYGLDANLEGYVEYSANEVKKVQSFLPHNRLIVIGALPHYSFNILYCLGLPHFIPQKTPHDCLKEEVGDNQKRVALNAGLARKLKALGIIFVNPTDYFCDKRYCYASEKGGLFVFDDSHLSAEGSDYFIGQVKGIIR